MRTRKSRFILILTAVLSLGWLSLATYTVASMPTKPVNLYATEANFTAKSSKSTIRAPNQSVVDHSATAAQTSPTETTGSKSSDSEQSEPAPKSNLCVTCPLETTTGNDITPICQSDCPQPKPFPDCPVCKPTLYHVMCPMIACRLPEPPSTL